MIKTETLLRALMRQDNDDLWTYTVWGSTPFSEAKSAELMLVRTWTKWAVSVEVEVDEYSTYDGTGLKRRWWFVCQVGPLSLVYSRERRVS